MDSLPSSNAYAATFYPPGLTRPEICSQASRGYPPFSSTTTSVAGTSSETRDSHFTAIDWESANPAGLPLWDLWYFLADALPRLHQSDGEPLRALHSPLPR